MKLEPKTPKNNTQSEGPFSLKVYGRNLDNTIVFKDPYLRKIEEAINNLKRLNLVVERTDIENLNLESLKIEEEKPKTTEDPKKWQLNELVLK